MLRACEAGGYSKVSLIFTNLGDDFALQMTLLRFLLWWSKSCKYSDKSSSKKVNIYDVWWASGFWSWLAGSFSTHLRRPGKCIFAALVCGYWKLSHLTLPCHGIELRVFRFDFQCSTTDLSPPHPIPPPHPHQFEWNWNLSYVLLLQC